MRTLRSLVATVVVAAVLTAVVPAPAGSATPQAPAQAACQRTLPVYPELAPGAHGKAVRSLQCVLNDAGLGPVTVDGSYGPETRAAIKELFGSFEGPVEHPFVVKNWYWTILFARSHRLRGLEQGDSGIRVRTLQRALRADGAAIVVDGDFGAQTTSRVAAFQGSCDITQTGRVDGDTVFFLSMGGCGG
jgi:peptidoglycan hydrolase-like protein with peptidoglycan-binding domain